MQAVVAVRVMLLAVAAVQESLLLDTKCKSKV
jgi:hypothetical protein